MSSEDGVRICFLDSKVRAFSTSLSCQPKANIVLLKSGEVDSESSSIYRHRRKLGRLKGKKHQEGKPFFLVPHGTPLVPKLELILESKGKMKLLHWKIISRPFCEVSGKEVESSKVFSKESQTH